MHAEVENRAGEDQQNGGHAGQPQDLIGEVRQRLDGVQAQEGQENAKWDHIRRGGRAHRDGQGAG